jgi:hypothetical protein
MGGSSLRAKNGEFSKLLSVPRMALFQQSTALQHVLSVIQKSFWSHHVTVAMYIDWIDPRPQPFERFQSTTATSHQEKVYDSLVSVSMASDDQEKLDQDLLDVLEKESKEFDKVRDWHATHATLNSKTNK